MPGADTQARERGNHEQLLLLLRHMGNVTWCRLVLVLLRLCVSYARACVRVVFVCLY